jgi:hypothetical protein
MKVTKLLKKFRNLDPAEERLIAVALYEGKPALDVVKEYLLMETSKVDKQLLNVQELYSGHGDNSLLVATVLARRSAFIKLYDLLSKEISLDDDQSKE